MFLYNHNSVRINTKFFSLGNNLNYSYGLVVRVATCSEAWGTVKMVHENENQSMDVSWRQSWNEEHHPEKNHEWIVKRSKNLYRHYIQLILYCFFLLVERKNHHRRSLSKQLSRKRLVLSLLYLEHKLWLVALEFLKLTPFRWPKCHFCVEAKPCTWRLAQILLGTADPRCCRQVASRAIQAPALGLPPVHTTATLQWNRSSSQAGNINYFHQLELNSFTIWFCVERKVTWQVTKGQKVSAMLIPTQQ